MTPRPPRFSAWLVEHSLASDDRAAVLGDLTEEFDARATRDGIPSARRWYRRQVRRSLVPNLRSRIAPVDAAPRTPLLGGLARDARDALRALRAAPSFTAVALMVLTLGIGASTAIYSVVDAVVLRALPFDHADRIVAVSESFKGRPGAGGVSPQDFLDWRARQDAFEALAATATPGDAFRLEDGNRNYRGLRVTRASAELFAVLRVTPQLGRVFTRENEVTGNERVAVISDDFWRRQFGGDPHVVGQTMRMTNGTWEILGVMPPGFTYPTGRIPMDLWVPYAMSAAEKTRTPINRHNMYLRVIARVKSGVSGDEASARMNQLMRGLAAESPSWFADVRAEVRPLKDAVVGSSTRSWLLMLLGAVGCVLLIASVNVANLLLARATVRSREIGIRLALGASRWQIVRSLLVESLILALVGTALGVTLAYWGVDVLRASLPIGVPRAELIAVNLRVLGVATLTAMTTGVLFGIVPAFQGSRISLTGALRDGGRGGTAGAGRQRLRMTLVVAEVSLAVVLLVGAGLFVSSFIRLMRIDVGLDYHRVLAVGVYPPIDATSKTQRPIDMARAASALTEIVERARAIPGVEAASGFAGGLPLTNVEYVQGVTLPGRPDALSDNEVIDIHRVTPDYPKTMRVPLVRGRLFADAENRAGAAPVVLLNEIAAARYFAGGDALGATIGVEGDRTVVGIVGNTRPGGPEADAGPEAYIPLAQGGIRSGYLMIRTNLDPAALAAPVRALVFGVAPDARIGEFESLDGIFSVVVAQQRFNMLLVGLFGALAIAIASAGIYGVVSYLVEQRTKEIGVRMALGAVPALIIRLILGRSALVVSIGVAIGLAGAWLLSRLASAFLFEVQPHDPVIFMSVAIGLIVVGLLAAFVPALRATRVDPLVALRTD